MRWFKRRPPIRRLGEKAHVENLILPAMPDVPPPPPTFHHVTVEEWNGMKRQVEREHKLAAWRDED